jgi:hypothetical protein
MMMTVWRKPLRSIVIAVALLLSTAGNVQAQLRHEIVLVPFDTATVPGKYGTTWSSEIWVHNSRDQPVNLIPECSGFDDCTRRIDIQPRQTRLVDAFPLAQSHPVGIFLFVPKDRVGHVHFHQRVRNLSGTFASEGTEIPVVPTSEFRSGVTNLLNVPIDTRYRLLLRVYFDTILSVPFFSATVLVRVYSMEGDQGRLAEQEFRFSHDTVTDGGLRIDAPMVDCSAVLARVRDLASLVRVEIIPKTSRSKYWPLLSVTSNETHQVTIITAQ